MIDRNDRLKIFENFRVDYELPKFKKPVVPVSQILEHGGIIDLNSRVDIMSKVASGITFSRNSTIRMSEDSEDVEESPLSPSWWKVLTRFLWKKEPVPRMSVEAFFKSVKNSAEELRFVEERAYGYEKAIERAKTAGQRALVEQLGKTVVAVRAETQLLTMKLPKYLEEEAIVAFIKQTKKGLRLDWVANFTRVIPDALITLKADADARGIFDNYVVLHYDPTAKSWAETEEEKARRRDPILFGVIEGRRRLYYVGDWVDDLCDLTLDQVADLLGKEVVKEIPRVVDVESIR